MRKGTLLNCFEILQAECGLDQALAFTNREKNILGEDTEWHRHRIFIEGIVLQVGAYTQRIQQKAKEVRHHPLIQQYLKLLHELLFQEWQEAINGPKLPAGIYLSQLNGRIRVARAYLQIIEDLAKLMTCQAVLDALSSAEVQFHEKNPPNPLDVIDPRD